MLKYQLRVFKVSGFYGIRVLRYYGIKDQGIRVLGY